MAYCRKLNLLLWKNCRLLRHNWFRAIIDVVVGPVLAQILVYVFWIQSQKAQAGKPFTLSPYDESKIAWSPKDNSSREFTDDVHHLMTSLAPGPKWVAFSSETEMVEELLKSSGMTEGTGGKLYFMAGVVLHDSSSAGRVCTKGFQVTIRFPALLRKTGTPWPTDLLFNKIVALDTSVNSMYTEEHFLGLQSHLSSAILKHCGVKTDVKLQLNRYPIPSGSQKLPYLMSQVFPGCVLAGFTLLATSAITSINLEKRRGLKELMKMAGIPGSLQLAAWFIHYFILGILSAALTFVLLKYLSSEGHTLIDQTDPSIVVVFILACLLSALCLCVLFSTFFKKAAYAAIAYVLFCALSYLVYMLLSSTPRSIVLLTLAFVIFNIPMPYGFYVMVNFEEGDQKLTWSNVMTPVSKMDELSMGHVLIILVVNAILYILLSMYLDELFPGKYGVAKSCIFPCKWFSCRRRMPRHTKEHLPRPSSQAPPANFESEPKDLPVGIEIKNLTKVHADNTVIVDNLNLTMYKGQITVLLGPGGAGKTTAISMLVGLCSVTGGTATIEGYDIRNSMMRVRRSLGLCPQENILFDHLTVRNHLYFFAKMKGMKGVTLKEEVDKYLRVLRLRSKRNFMAKKLSGGEKRKLCVAIALCGNSKVVILDEPSKGMDPQSRQDLWTLLLQERRDRTILLTSQYMSEAESLGDRTAIMADGRLKCCGSSLFLKDKFGAGYWLVLHKDDGCEAKEVHSYVQGYIPNITPPLDFASELSFKIGKANSKQLTDLIGQLEKEADRLKVKSFVISSPPMEEVLARSNIQTYRAMSLCLYTSIANGAPHHIAKSTTLQHRKKRRRE